MAHTKRFPFIEQSGMMECGVASLAMILRYHGLDDCRSFIAETIGVCPDGVDLLSLSKTAEAFGFDSNGYSADLDYLQSLENPCIVHFDGNHFVVVYACDQRSVYIADPAIGKKKLRVADFVERWNGVVLAIDPTPELNVEVSPISETARDFNQRSSGLLKTTLLETMQNLWRECLTVFICAAAFQLLSLGVPFSIQYYFDQVLPSQSLKQLVGLLVALSVLLLCIVFLGFLRDYAVAKFKVGFERDFFERFFKHFISLEQRYFDSLKKEDFISRFQENLRIREALNPRVFDSLTDVFFIFIFALAMAYFSPTLVCIAAVFFFLYTLAFVHCFPLLKNSYLVAHLETVGVLAIFIDSLLGIAAVRRGNNQHKVLERWRNRYAQVSSSVLDAEKTSAVIEAIFRLISGAAYISVAGAGAVLVFNGYLSLGRVIGFFAVFMMALQALDRLSGGLFVFAEVSLALDRVIEIFRKDQYAEPEETQETTALAIPKLMVSGLSFGYAGKEHVLNEVSFEACSGDFIGIVGRNGSGKTTLAQLLSGIYRDYAGDIVLGNHDLKKIPLRLLNEKVYVFPQEVYLFDDTLLENIRYGRSDATDDEVIEAARFAGVDAFAESMYLGYQTRIGDNGIRLSGGMALRIEFARLFCANPDLIVLDEASSALDPAAERMLFKQVRKKFSEKIVFSIAHRIETLDFANKIFVFEDGKLVETGSHSELISDRNSFYQAALGR